MFRMLHDDIIFHFRGTVSLRTITLRFQQHIDPRLISIYVGFLTISFYADGLGLMSDSRGTLKTITLSFQEHVK